MNLLSNHHHLVHLIDIFIGNLKENYELIIITSRIDKTKSISKLIKSESIKHNDVQDVLLICKKIFKTFCYLKQRSIYCENLTISNIYKMNDEIIIDPGFYFENNVNKFDSKNSIQNLLLIFCQIKASKTFSKFENSILMDSTIVGIFNDFNMFFFSEF